MARVLTSKNLGKISSARPMKSAVKSENRVESYEKIRLYNFRIPNRFTKDQLRALRGIYENFSTSLSSHLSGLLRKFCQVDLMSIEEHTFSEFNNTILDPVLLAIIELSPNQGLSLMEVSPSLTCGIIDRLMGGAGQFSNQNRNYTEIEVALMEKLSRQLIDIMRESWAIFCETTPKLERIETRSQFAQIVPSGETIAIVTFYVKMGEVGGTINYCIPHVLIESLFKNAKTKLDFFETTPLNLENKSGQILNKLERTPLSLVGSFSETTITTQEVMSLQVGDVILIDHKVNEEVDIKIKGVTKFKGYIGTKNNKRSIKVSTKVEFDNE